MKTILVIYLLLQLLAAIYLYIQLEGDINRHLILTGSAVLLYLAVCFRNPGYAHKENLKGVIEPEESGSVTSSHTLHQIKTNKEKKPVETRQCRVCHKPQLLRMKHCYDCEQCVATFDHHCIWIQNCVGQKNRPLFFLTVVSNLVSILFAFCQLIATMWERGEKKTHQLIFLSLVGVVLSALALLFGLHSYLMCANLTTWQVTRRDKIWYLKERNNQKSPFFKGVLSNIKEYWLWGWKKPFKSWEISDQGNFSKQQTSNQ